MRFCNRCLYGEHHPLNITFDSEGVCSGCRIHEEKDELDWSERRLKLQTLLDAYRSDSSTSYDCIVPVSGARDSYFIVHTLKYEFGMNPLLVTYNKQYNTRLGIQNLAYLQTLMDCDLLTMTVDPRVVRRLTEITLEKMASMYWHCIAGQTVFPVRTAVQLKIPLIVWGAHQGCDQVGMFSHRDEVEMTRKYRKEHDLMGFEAEDLVSESAGLPERDVTQFFYPHSKDIEKVGVRGIYLSNYIRWDSKAQHEQMIERYEYRSANQQRTFDRYNDVDCFHYSGLHDYIKFAKHGYGKVVDHACREIRLKRLSRDAGIALIKKYQHVEPEDLGLFLKWIGMGKEQLSSLIDERRNPAIWRQDSAGSWDRVASIENTEANEKVKDCSIYDGSECSFELTPQRDPKMREENYVLFGKGYVHTDRQ